MDGKSFQEIRDQIPADALDRVDPSRLSTLALMVLAALERGGPVPLEEMQERLGRAGVLRTKLSLKRAWARGAPLTVTREEGLALRRDPEACDRLWMISFHVREQLGLLPRPQRPEPAAPSSPPDTSRPLTAGELEVFARERFFTDLSPRRLLVALLDVAGEPMPVAAAAARFRDRYGFADERDLRRSVSGPPGALRIDEADRLHLDRAHPSVAATRGKVRGINAAAAARAQQQAGIERRIAASRERDREHKRARRRWYSAARKRLLRCAFDGDRLAGASLLDPDGRTFEELDDPPELASRLAGCDLIIGLDVREDLDRLGFDPGERGLLDLAPPAKTRRLNRRGRTLRITPELILRSTLGTSRPLGEPPRLVRYARDGQQGKLHRRLRADLKNLWALYRYGQLNHAVRLRWGFLDEDYDVGWNRNWVPDLRELMNEAFETGRLLEAVLDRPPAWSDPWGRARRLRVLRQEGYPLPTFSLAPAGPEPVAPGPAEVFEARVVQPG